MAQMMVRRLAAVSPSDEVVAVALDDLDLHSSFREGGLNEEHVERLVSLDGRWPPVLVNRRDHVVIDGSHRVAAARRLGRDRIEACFFEGGPDEALIEFIRRNVYHGLPLTLRERKRAASQVLVAHPEWSDRRIAELCAISPKTVGRIRMTLAGRATKEFPQLDTTSRIGRDNKCRPVNSALVRSRVLEAIKKEPQASLRAVARSVGVSPETVRLVRMNLVPRTPSHAVTPVPDPRPEPVSKPGAAWKSDRALSACQDGEFVSWFDATAVAEAGDYWRWVDAVPLSRVYEVAEEARRRAEYWTDFARALEARSTKQK